MALVALISNPLSTGNKAALPLLRAYCAENADIFHYEVEHVDQIEAALRTIARTNPSVLVVNGGDGTVQSVLTELYHGDYFAGKTPPLAVLPNGKTNLIAQDLGATGNALESLRSIVRIARGDLSSHIIDRQLIELSQNGNERPVLGMFLGGAGLAEIILYCRNKIYPLGLPNSISHFLAATASILSIFIGGRARSLPATRSAVKISRFRDGELSGSFALVMVTTLERLLLRSTAEQETGPKGTMKFVAVEHNHRGLWTMIKDTYHGRFGSRRGEGVHFALEDELQIDSDNGTVLLDGELFTASQGKPIILRTTAPIPFLRIAA